MAIDLTEVNSLKSIQKSILSTVFLSNQAQDSMPLAVEFSVLSLEVSLVSLLWHSVIRYEIKTHFCYGRACLNGGN